MTLNLALQQIVIDSPLCAECGGECCKKAPGIYWPEDIEPLTGERILEMVRQEKCAIDWYDGDPRPDGDLWRVYWIRPAIKGVDQPLDPSWGGECVHLTDAGCSVPAGERPRQCLALTPLPIVERRANGGCHFDEVYKLKRGPAMAWIPYQNLMSCVVQELEDCP